jgi:hypothetical protein
VSDDNSLARLKTEEAHQILERYVKTTLSSDITVQQVHYRAEFKTWEAWVVGTQAFIKAYIVRLDESPDGDYICRHITVTPRNSI